MPSTDSDIELQESLVEWTNNTKKSPWYKCNTHCLLLATVSLMVTILAMTTIIFLTGVYFFVNHGKDFENIIRVASTDLPELIDRLNTMLTGVETITGDWPYVMHSFNQTGIFINQAEQCISALGICH